MTPLAKKQPNLWDPFTRPVPTWSCLTNPAILIQAWKKTHNYLRSKSWFADVLELDLSAIDLQKYIATLHDTVQAGPKSFAPHPSRLVPAPKSDEHPWVFSKDGWSPGSQTKLFTRPLAHLRLQDQVLATAIMICLADYVESAQGNCGLPTRDAQNMGVSSYGNRLHCDWTATDAAKHSAEFAWGNTATYRKYYIDYRAFLMRPMDVCRHHYSMKSEAAELGVVSLDLQGFYDNIEPSKVTFALKSICYAKKVTSDDQFWQAVEECFTWNWDPSDDKLKLLLKSASLPRGLPQGLVSAGFFSNAYMVEFDRALAQIIARKRPKIGGCWEIVDYCRYVDDIRLVVVGDSTGGSSDVKNLCSKWFQRQMTAHITEQKCNGGKSAYVSQEELESRTIRPTLMSAIQEKLSGPVDLETLEQAGFALDGLLNTVGEQSDNKTKTPGEGSAEPSLALSRIHVAKHSVRDDTVVRFAAYRKLTSLRARRYFQAAEEAEAQTLAMKRIDAEIEFSARSMLRLWSRDPSLAIVLRHALNLFPSPELLEPAIEALKFSIFSKSTRAGQRSAFSRSVGLFTCGELFKAGVVETGIDVEPHELPEKADIDGYREVLADLAVELLNEVDTPWYVARPAVMFLLSVGRVPSLAEPLQQQIGEDYQALIEIASGGLPLAKSSHEKQVALILVLDQLGDDRNRTLSRLRRAFAGFDAEKQKRLGEQLYLSNPQVASEFLRHLKTKRASERQYNSLLASFPTEQSQDQHSTKDLGTKATLSKVMTSRDNPFVQETAALKLLRGLAKAILQNKIGVENLHPDGIRVSCKSWMGLINARTSSKLSFLPQNRSRKDPRYGIPAWATGARESLYALGRLVRAAVIGSTDYTSTGFQLNQSRDGYQGLRSSWFKRQHGLSNDLTLSEWDPSSSSPWFSSLISHLLAWPGCRNDADGEFTRLANVSDLLKVVRHRLGKLKEMYGRSSNLPMYEVEITHPLKEPPILSMALLQTVRPTHEDLLNHGPELSTNQFRPIHRSHLASMLRIAAEHVALRKSYDKKPFVDLVVLPEIAVHRGDLDLLRRFIDATQAIMFCGLAFWQHPRRGGLVNSGLWIIPDLRKSGRSFRYLLQGKEHMTPAELKMKIVPNRPHQYILKLDSGNGRKPYSISAAICFDATDLHLASDLRDQTDMLIVAANNRDVPTFDTMASALSWHMFQHIVIVNSGEFGGSVVSAPYKERFQRVLKHDHGGHQAAVSIVEIDLSDYQRMRERPPSELKSPPAGFSRH